jgi:ribonuclease P protein component
LSRAAKLRNSSEFRIVYESGKRYDGRLVTAFVWRNDCGHHRLGITASRKVSRAAVGRNRLKRLLRETFRLSGMPLQELSSRYDWVLNAKRSLLEVKLATVLEEFEGIIARLARDEQSAEVKAGKPRP